MRTIDVTSLTELKRHLNKNKKSFLLLFKKDSEQSRCALENVEKMDMEEPLPVVMTADVSSVRDIHPEYQITSVPALLEFEGEQLKNVRKGCHHSSVLKSIFDEAAYVARMEKEGREVKHVTVYSTPTCSWCTTLKSWLAKNKIRYSDVDISRNPNAAQDLVRRTGQQGVPQTEINGQWVVGFDQTKLEQLLEIKTNR